MERGRGDKYVWVLCAVMSLKKNSLVYGTKQYQDQCAVLLSQLVHVFVLKHFTGFVFFTITPLCIIQSKSFSERNLPKVTLEQKMCTQPGHKVKVLNCPTSHSSIVLSMLLICHCYHYKTFTTTQRSIRGTGCCEFSSLDFHDFP